MDWPYRLVDGLAEPLVKLGRYGTSWSSPRGGRSVAGRATTKARPWELISASRGPGYDGDRRRSTSRTKQRMQHGTWCCSLPRRACWGSKVHAANRMEAARRVSAISLAALPFTEIPTTWEVPVPFLGVADRLTRSYKFYFQERVTFPSTPINLF